MGRMRWSRLAPPVLAAVAFAIAAASGPPAAVAIDPPWDTAGVRREGTSARGGGARDRRRPGRRGRPGRRPACDAGGAVVPCGPGPRSARHARRTSGRPGRCGRWIAATDGHRARVVRDRPVRARAPDGFGRRAREPSAAGRPGRGLRARRRRDPRCGPQRPPDGGRIGDRRASRRSPDARGPGRVAAVAGGCRRASHRATAGCRRGIRADVHDRARVGHRRAPGRDELRPGALPCAGARPGDGRRAARG